MIADEIRSFLSDLSVAEGELKQDHASGDHDRDAMWEREKAHMGRFYRDYYFPLWTLVSGSPGSSKAKKKATAYRPITVHKVTPYAHPSLEVWVVAISEPYRTSPPYSMRLAVAPLEGAPKVIGHQQVCDACYPEGGCGQCTEGWLPWNEGNNKTSWLETLGGPSGPAVRFTDPGPRFAALHERED